MKNEKTIEALNTLVQINNDRIEGYETAIKETKETDLKDLFMELSRTSFKCKNELDDTILKLGGTPTESTKITGKFFRMWMDVKVALSSNDRKTILNSCEFGEDMAVETYNKVLRDKAEDLSAEQLKMVEDQFTLINADHYKVKNLRNKLVEAI